MATIVRTDTILAREGSKICQKDQFWLSISRLQLSGARHDTLEIIYTNNVATQDHSSEIHHLQLGVFSLPRLACCIALWIALQDEMALLKATLAEVMLFSHLEASELDMLFKAMHVDGFPLEL
jgi:hypothetical protein